jgi:hypothetical protein
MSIFPEFIRSTFLRATAQAKQATKSGMGDFRRITGLGTAGSSESFERQMRSELSELNAKMAAFERAIDTLVALGGDPVEVDYAPFREAARLLYEAMDGEPRIFDFQIACAHLESLHSHDAVAVINKGVDRGFNGHIDDFRSLIC